MGIILAISFIATACNKKEDDPDKKENQPSLSVAVKSFRLSADARVMANLDSVFFSIDLDRGIIFNADSLPKGTSIEKLIPVITFPSTVESAEIIMAGGNRREGTVDYKKNPTDTIDFSGSVILRLQADGGNLTRDYRIRINVHNAVADSLMWDKVALAPLPSRIANPKEQKTVKFHEDIYTLVREADDTYTIAYSPQFDVNSWRTEKISLPFTPDVRSFTATDNSLYILSDKGVLKESSNGKNWINTIGDETWHCILGGSGATLLGLTGNSSDGYRFASSGGSTNISQSVPDDFPDEGFSNMLTFYTKWSTAPYAFISGGRRDGKVLADTWAFDGERWAKISNKKLPPLSDALMVPYFVYRKTSTSWIQTEYSVTLCFGGRNADGTISREVWLSYDNGVNWQKADRLMQLPDFIPSFYSADAVVCSSPMDADLEGWISKATPKPRGFRLQYFVDGTDVYWECPYIYMFGGMTDEGLSDNIWRAVLARLTFAPLF